MPVPRELMQEPALTTAIKKGIANFNTSNGYIENFMRRASIQNSVRFHGHGGSTIANGHEEPMNQIQEICTRSEISTIWTNLVCSTGCAREYPICLPLTTEDMFEELTFRGKKIG